MTVTLRQVPPDLIASGGPLAGRAAEMESLRRAWRDAAAGRPRLVLLAGEAGVGKTRLAAELAAEVDVAGAAVLFGRSPAAGAEAYHPLVEALGPLPAVGAAAGREAMFEAVGSTIAARARRAPVLLVLDDLHRADPSTLVALRRVLDGAAGIPLLVLATCREGAGDRSHPLGGLLAPDPGSYEVERICVEGLTPEALVEMVGDGEVAQRLWRHSEGNPVVVGELLLQGALDGPVPPAFDDLVARRVEALAPPARSLLQAAAVSGSEFRVDVAGRAARLSAERARSALNQLVAAGFLVAGRAGPSSSCRFVHELVREAVERRLELPTRVRLHLRIARALEAMDPAGGVPPALVAWHFRAAAPVGGSAAARLHSVRAGRLAMESLGWEEAAECYGHALAAAAGVDPGVRVELLLSLGEAQRLAGETARARQAFLEAAMLARSSGDGTRMAQAALAMGQVAAVWGADHELETLAGEARALLGDPPAATPATVFDDFSSDALYDVLDGVAPGSPPVPEAPGAAVPVPATPPGAGSRAESAPAAPLPTGPVLRARHVALAGPEHAAERLAAAQDFVALAEAGGDDGLAATGRGWRLVDALELGRLDQADSDRAAHAELARRLGDPRHARDAAAWSAMRAIVDGRVDDARTSSAAAYALALEAGDPEADDSFLVQRWWLATEWAGPRELAEVAGECRARGDGAGGRAWRAAAALAFARAGDLELAAEELRRATRHGLGELVGDPDRLHPLSCLVEAAWILGDTRRAVAAAALLDPFVDHMVVAGRGLALRGSVARVCGLAAASAHRFDEAERHFSAALAVHRRLGTLPLLARTRYEWSRTLLERGRKGDRRRAAESRRRSAELAARLGMERLAEEIATPAS